jgi:phosphoglycolate phosphatase-like HAD superfamily hydrolase
MVRVMKKYYQLRPGVRELFRQFDDFSSAPRVAVYSDYPFLKERMEALGLCPGSGIPLYSSDFFGAQKPAVRPFRRIAADLGAAPDEVLVIGDREGTDGLGAFRAGMHFFCLETGRKHYFRLDPYRRYIEEKPQGPSLLMYAGAWDDLHTTLTERYFK